MISLVPTDIMCLYANSELYRTTDSVRLWDSSLLTMFLKYLGPRDAILDTCDPG